MSGCCATEVKNKKERKLLWIVLVLNATMFFVEFIAGWIANSTSLMADSLDMLADAVVYTLSLYAVGKSMQQKARSALVNGYLQLSLGVFVLAHIVWKIYTQATPDEFIMTWIAALALAVNLTCFIILYQFRQGDVNLRASWICSRNDILANCGVIVAALLVPIVNSAWPDWFIAAVIALIVIQSAGKVIKEANAQLVGTGNKKPVCTTDNTAVGTHQHDSCCDEKH
ncbi:RND efflux system protein [Catenovulum agarivorans DS-2]|uniref:RND efflux system protein n=1 Tax=Catenovulum agarivorans DS-2 TaxID=1328313 RepID=W7QW26_9ALTE|nr:RND efflux system protein [Catenovulum agarivorans DS-2]